MYLALLQAQFIQRLRQHQLALQQASDPQRPPQGMGGQMMAQQQGVPSQMMAQQQQQQQPPAMSQQALTQQVLRELTPVQMAYLQSQPPVRRTQL